MQSTISIIICVSFVSIKSWGVGDPQSATDTMYLTSLTGEYSGSSSSEDEDSTSPKDKVLKNSKGLTDFRIKDIKIAPYGRKEIEMAEQGNT